MMKVLSCCSVNCDSHGSSREKTLKHCFDPIFPPYMRFGSKKCTKIMQNWLKLSHICVGEVKIDKNYRKLKLTPISSLICKNRWNFEHFLPIFDNFEEKTMICVKFCQNRKMTLVFSLICKIDLNFEPFLPVLDINFIKIVKMHKFYQNVKLTPFSPLICEIGSNFEPKWHYFDHFDVIFHEM